MSTPITKQIELDLKFKDAQIKSVMSSVCFSAWADPEGFKNKLEQLTQEELKALVIELENFKKKQSLKDCFFRLYLQRTKQKKTSRPGWTGLLAKELYFATVAVVAISPSMALIFLMFLMARMQSDASSIIEPSLNTPPWASISLLMVRRRLQKALWKNEIISLSIVTLLWKSG